jgi:hypothetical protein
MKLLSTIVLFCFSTVTTVDAAVAATTNSQNAAVTNHRRHQESSGGNSYYRHLHDILRINEDDPNQDIRTNIILNMEGL